MLLLCLRTALCRCVCNSALLLAIYGGTVVRAADVVTLRNGFTVACVSHTQITPDTLRLYLDGGTVAAASRNYLDVALASVLTITDAPDDQAPTRTGSADSADASALSLLLQQSGSAHNVNAALLASVIRAESAGRPRAISRAGAGGLMQLMPGTAAQLGVRDSFAPAQNVDGGSAYLDQLLTRYHENVILALAAYNAGPSAVDRYHGVPPFRETRLYVARVVREFNRLVQAEAAAAPTSAATVLPDTRR